MNESYTEEQIGAPFNINPELEALSPKMSKEEYADFVADLKTNGQREDIEVMTDKTIVNGHHRYHALKDIGVPDYKIAFKVISFQGIQQAKEYAFQIDDKQKHSTMYQRVTHALAVYGKDPDKDVASKMTGKVSTETVKSIRKLNLILASLVVTTSNPEIGLFLKQKCIQENEWYQTLKLLESAAVVNESIALIPTRADWNQSVTKDRRVKLQEKIKVKYEPLKYKDKTASKKILKEIPQEIENLQHPKNVNTKTESYVDDCSKVAEGFNDLIAKYPKQVFQTVINAGQKGDNYHSVPEDNLKDFFNGNLLPTKKTYILIAIELPEELVPDAN